jgi:hypothetical protein
MKRILKALTLVCASAATQTFADAGPTTILSTSEALPEPGSLAIFALAMLGVWAVKRHNDRK